MCSTTSLKGYRFPTHRTDLIVDRKESEAAEVFFAVLEPGEKTSLHQHDDCEQLWYVIEGCGTLTSGPGRQPQPIARATWCSPAETSRTAWRTPASPF